MSKLMTPSRPYLLRAFYEWITDNECTPYVVINATYPGTDVPERYVQDGRIILDVSSLAVKNLSMTNDFLEFNARFGGVATLVSAPIAAVMAIYAQENGHGMVFNDDDKFPPPHSATDGSEHKTPTEKKRPTLKIVKDDDKSSHSASVTVLGVSEHKISSEKKRQTLKIVKDEDKVQPPPSSGE